MTKLSSITIKKNANELSTNVTTHLEIRKDKIQDIKGTIALPKTKFQLQCEGAITIEELRERVYKHINSLPWKK